MKIYELGKVEDIITGIADRRRDWSYDSNFALYGNDVVMDTDDRIRDILRDKGEIGYVILFLKFYDTDVKGYIEKIPVIKHDCYGHNIAVMDCRGLLSDMRIVRKMFVNGINLYKHIYLLANVLQYQHKIISDDEVLMHAIEAVRQIICSPLDTRPTIFTDADGRRTAIYDLELYKYDCDHMKYKLQL